MTRLLAFLLALFLAAPALADQDDPALDPLFARLKQVETLEAGKAIEQAIWRLWLKHEDEAISQHMANGIGAMQAGAPRLAMAAFDKVVAAAPDYAEGWNKRATLRYAIGDHAGSAEDIARVLALEPRHFGALAGFGLLNMALERPAAAVAAFEQALEINPHMPAVRDTLEQAQALVTGARL